MGDFLGFTFGGVHSSDLGITRVSGGDRYEEELHPEIKDRTAEVPGLNGQYYFGSDFGEKTFDLEIAYDHLTEEQFRKLRQVFGTKEIKALIFDEHPYKTYMVKIGSPIELSYICFDEPKKVVGAQRDGIRRITRTEEETVIDEETGEETTQTVIHRDIEQVTPYEILEGTERIYKGEGKISFIAYFPFAKSTFEVLPQSGNKYYEGSESWADFSGILSADEYNQSQINTYDSETSQMTIYNGGDLPVGFRLYIPAALLSNNISLKYKPDTINTTAELNLESFTLKEGEEGILIDTTSELIVGVSEVNDTSSGATYTTSGNLYNGHITSGYLFHFEPNLNRSDRSILQIDNGSEDIKIFYDYLYF
jgi:hypothetical protein